VLFVIEDVEAGREARTDSEGRASDLDAALLEQARAQAGEAGAPIDARLLPTRDPVAHSLHDRPRTSRPTARSCRGRSG
jgi:hypothetical protein